MSAFRDVSVIRTDGIKLNSTWLYQIYVMNRHKIMLFNGCFKLVKICERNNTTILTIFHVCVCPEWCKKNINMSYCIYVTRTCIKKLRQHKPEERVSLSPYCQVHYKKKNANDFSTKDQIIDTSNDWFYEQMHSWLVILVYALTYIYTLRTVRWHQNYSTCVPW